MPQRWVSFVGRRPIVKSFLDTEHRGTTTHDDAYSRVKFGDRRTGFVRCYDSEAAVGLLYARLAGGVYIPFHLGSQAFESASGPDFDDYYSCRRVKRGGSRTSAVQDECLALGTDRHAPHLCIFTVGRDTFGHAVATDMSFYRNSDDLRRRIGDDNIGYDSDEGARDGDQAKFGCRAPTSEPAADDRGRGGDGSHGGAGFGNNSSSGSSPSSSSSSGNSSSSGYGGGSSVSGNSGGFGGSDSPSVANSAWTQAPPTYLREMQEVMHAAAAGNVGPLDFHALMGVGTFDQFGDDAVAAAIGLVCDAVGRSQLDDSLVMAHHSIPADLAGPRGAHRWVGRELMRQAGHSDISRLRWAIWHFSISDGRCLVVEVDIAGGRVIVYDTQQQPIAAVPQEVAGVLGVLRDAARSDQLVAPDRWAQGTSAFDGLTTERVWLYDSPRLGPQEQSTYCRPLGLRFLAMRAYGYTVPGPALPGLGRGGVFGYARRVWRAIVYEVVIAGACAVSFAPRREPAPVDLCTRLRGHEGRHQGRTGVVNPLGHGDRRQVHADVVDLTECDDWDARPSGQGPDRPVARGQSRRASSGRLRLGGCRMSTGVRAPSPQMYVVGDGTCPGCSTANSPSSFECSVCRGALREICAICQHDLSDSIQSTACGHTFHSVCLQRLLANYHGGVAARCPTCRQLHGVCRDTSIRLEPYGGSERTDSASDSDTVSDSPTYSDDEPVAASPAPLPPPAPSQAPSGGTAGSGCRPTTHVVRRGQDDDGHDPGERPLARISATQGAAGSAPALVASAGATMAPSSSSSSSGTSSRPPSASADTAQDLRATSVAATGRLVPAVPCVRVTWTEILTHKSAVALGQLDDRASDVLILMNGTLWSAARNGKETLASRLAACLEASLCAALGPTNDGNSAITVGGGRLRVNNSTTEDMNRSVVAVLRRPTLTEIGATWAGSGFSELDEFVRLETGRGTTLYALRGARAVVPRKPVHVNAGLQLERRSVYAGVSAARVAYRAIMGREAQGSVTFVTLTQGAAMYKLRHFGLDATRVDRLSYPKATRTSR